MEFWETNRRKVVLVSLVIVTIAIIAGSFLWPSARDVYNTIDVKIAEAVVQSKSSDSNAYYLQVSVPGTTNSALDVQTSSEFYQQASIGQKVGVLVGTVERYSARPSWNKEQLRMKYVSSNWEVLSVYPSLLDAEKENQSKTFTTTASLKQRIKSTDGRYFFLFDAGGKKVMAEVNSAYYQKYQPQNTPANTFELQFAANGDFNRLLRIVKP